MKDMLNREIVVGDIVLYVTKHSCNCGMRVARVLKTFDNKATVEVMLSNDRYNKGYRCDYNKPQGQRYVLKSLLYTRTISVPNHVMIIGGFNKGMMEEAFIDAVDKRNEYVKKMNDTY